MPHHGPSVLSQKFAERYPFALSLSKGESLLPSCFDKLSTNGEIMLRISDTGH